MTYNNIPRIEICGGILASFIFLLAFFGAGWGLYSILNGVVVLIGWRLLCGTDLTMAEVYSGVKGLPPEVASQLIQTATQNLERLRKLTDVLMDANQKSCLEQINSISQAIMQQVMAEPNKLVSISRFIQVYLDGIVSVGEKFTALKEKDPDKIKNFNEFLDQAKDTCVSQQKALTADAILDLNTEITVLKRRMQAEPVHS